MRVPVGIIVFVVLSVSLVIVAKIGWMDADAAYNRIVGCGFGILIYAQVKKLTQRSGGGA